MSWNAHSELYFSQNWVERGGGEDSGEVPLSLPHSEYFFYDSLEIVMKGRPGGEKQLFAQNSIQRPGFCCLEGGF